MRPRLSGRYAFLRCRLRTREYSDAVASTSGAGEGSGPRATPCRGDGWPAFRRLANTIWPAPTTSPGLQAVAGCQFPSELVAMGVAGVCVCVCVWMQTLVFADGHQGGFPLLGGGTSQSARAFVLIIRQRSLQHLHASHQLRTDCGDRDPGVSQREPDDKKIEAHQHQCRKCLCE